jgi:flavin-dependent dehydrogenase
MPTLNQYDIIIVGAGPAGISTALHLADLSGEFVSRVLILEKGCHPRHKLCGGGILPDAEAILCGLGLDITEIPHVDVDWAHFDYAGKGMRMRAEKKGLFAFRVIRRHEFDNWLAAKAREHGFTIRENSMVKSLTVTKTGVVVRTDQDEYHAGIVVGADGSNSVVRRAVIPHERLHVARLLEVVSESNPGKSFHIQRNSYFDFAVLPQGIQGYVWDFPAVEQGKPVRVRGIFDCNILPHKAAVSLRAALEEELERHGLDLSEYKLEGHPLRWFDPGSAFSAPNLLLAGDAAGADALFGEGISIALGYGRLAALAIQDAFIREDFNFHQYKRSILQSELGKSLCRRTWLARFFYRLHFPQLQAFVWQKMGWFIEWAMQSRNSETGLFSYLTDEIGGI